MILRCDNCLSARGEKNSLDSFPSLKEAVSGLSEEDLENWARALEPLEGNEEMKSPQEDPENIQILRYRRVLSLLGGSPVMQALLDLMLALFFFPEFGACLSRYFGYSVNLHLAFLMQDELFPKEQEILSLMENVSRICYVDRRAFPLQYVELSLDERTVSYIFGEDEVNPLLSGFTFLYDPERTPMHKAILYEELIREGAGFLGRSFQKEDTQENAVSLRPAGVLQLSGKGGRRFLSKKIAEELKKPFLFLNIADLFREADKDRMEELTSALIRDAILFEAGVCFYGITEHFLRNEERENPMLKRDLEVLERILFLPVRNMGSPLILCTDAARAMIFSVEAGEYRLIELPPKPSYEERKKLWEGFSSMYGISLSTQHFAMRYRLNASEISAMILGYIERKPGITLIDAKEEEIFAKLCIQRAESDEGKGVGRIVYPSIRLNDVKIKPQLRSVLVDAIEGIKNSALILDSWGLRKKYPYGRCVSLLLSGPPGTGKTMTANAIAGELGLPLYQVNLSNIVDKYIGETEKNLEKAFLFAEKTDAVLFFDEADSLFGSRSEVHDSKDRYANTEVSYLLQRIEAYDGIVILATNILGNIDPAFLRRIRYMIRFENPDEAIRREIWMSCVTEEMPHEELDWDYLAAQFDRFTGSMIKTVFLNACAYAAGRGEIFGMPHLIHAIRQELEKTSKVAFSGDVLGKYAYMG